MHSYKNLKVLYVGSPPLFGKGASSIHILKMCQAMSNLGIQVELVLPGKFSKERLFRYYDISADFPVKNIPYTDKFARQITHGIAAAYYAKINRKKYEVVLTRNIMFAYLATVYMGIPTIYDAHHPPVNGLADRMIKTFINSRHFIGMSFNTNGLLKIYKQRGILPKNTVVAHNGVEIDNFKVNTDKNRLRQELKLPVNAVIVTYSGNTYEGRGIEYLIDAAKSMKDVEFLVVGGREKDNSIYKQFIGDMGISNIQFTGYVEHRKVADYLVASDILVMPYTNKVTIRDGKDASKFTSPIKLFEYMAAERPIIATSVPSVMEILKAGINSLIIRPEDTSELEKAIKALINDKNVSLFIAKNARREVASYTWEKRVEKIFSGFNITANMK